MRYGELSVLSCSLMWSLSSVCLVCTAQPKLASTRAAFNLVIRRPRIVGGTLTIALDSTVKLVKGSITDTEHHIIRLQHGPNGKTLTMRASSPQEREYWVVAIAAAMSTSVHYRNVQAFSTGNVPKTSSTKSQPTAYGGSTRGDYSLRRMIQQNVPAAIQFFLTVGQIIAAAH